MNERVYVSAVADRVNVGKDEGLRFSGWIEPHRVRENDYGAKGRGEIRVAGTEGGFVSREAEKISRPTRACVRARVDVPGSRIFMRYITYSGK